MSAATAHKPIVHFVGSIPLPDAETVFRTLAAATTPHLKRLPDGETGIRRTWIRFLQQVLADNAAIEVASDVPSFKFTQWDGKLLREIPRLRVKPGARLDPATVKTRYADMAIESWRLFDRLQQEGVIPAGVKFQISLPTPIAPTYNNMVPSDRPALIPVLTTHLLGEVAAIAQALPNDRIALQWDVCQEVIAWEGYYEPGPVDFRKETIAELIAIGDGVPAAIELGYHLCYGSPADEHVIQPKDAGIMVEMTNAVSAGVRRSIEFFHLPVPEVAPGNRALSRPRSSRRYGWQRCSPRCRPAPCPGRRRRHRMWYGARRSRAFSGAARSARADRRTGNAGLIIMDNGASPRKDRTCHISHATQASSMPLLTPPRLHSLKLRRICGLGCPRRTLMKP